MTITPLGQVFFEAEATALHGRCRCDRSGSCDWCRVYYDGPDGVSELLDAAISLEPTARLLSWPTRQEADDGGNHAEE